MNENLILCRDPRSDIVGFFFFFFFFFLFVLFFFFFLFVCLFVLFFVFLVGRVGKEPEDLSHFLAYRSVAFVQGDSHICLLYRASPHIFWAGALGLCVADDDSQEAAV